MITWVDYLRISMDIYVPPRIKTKDSTNDRGNLLVKFNFISTDIIMIIINESFILCPLNVVRR